MFLTLKIFHHGKEKQISKRNTDYLPKGAHNITAYLVVDGAVKFIDFAKKAFGAQQESISSEGGRVMNANLIIGDSAIMVSDTMDDMHTENAMLYLYVKDVDVTFKKAIDAGANELQPVKDQFYGDRSGAVKDQWGNKWWIATHQEDVSEAELQKRSKKAMSEQKKSKEPVEA